MRGSVPAVIIVDPALTTTYGKYGHGDLKSGEWTSIFRDAKKKIKEAASNGDLSKLDQQKAEDDAADAEDSSERSFENWKTANGKSVRMKLIKFESGKFIFKTITGKIIRAAEKHLSTESASKAKKALGME